MLLHFPHTAALPALQHLPVLAVDLGFGAAKTCGLASNQPGPTQTPICVGFGKAVAVVAEFVEAHPESACIIEAPLSGLFDQRGNPTLRPFEREVSDGEVKTRRWYVQAGAAVALGALVLLREVQARVATMREVHLIEGFVTFKRKKSPDSDDALALLDVFKRLPSDNIMDLSPGEGERAINLLSIAGLAPPGAPCPAVLRVDWHRRSVHTSA